MTTLLPDGPLFLRRAGATGEGRALSLELLDLSTGRLEVVGDLSPDVFNIAAVRG